MNTRLNQLEVLFSESENTLEAFLNRFSKKVLNYKDLSSKEMIQYIQQLKSGIAEFSFSVTYHSGEQRGQHYLWTIEGFIKGRCLGIRKQTSAGFIFPG